jgi:hypothetical protein
LQWASWTVYCDQCNPRVLIREYEQVVLLVDRSFVKGTKELVKESKCALGPNNKVADVATRCKLEKVETTDVNHFNSRQIAECFDNVAIFIVDNEGAAALTVTAIVHLSLTSAKLARVGHLYDIADYRLVEAVAGAWFGGCET